MKFNLRSLLLACSLGGLSVTSQADDLLQIFQLAQSKDPQILQSKASRDIAFEQITASRAALLPQINLGAGASYTATDSDADSIVNANASLGLSQALFNQINWTNFSIAEKNASRADISYAADLQNLILRVTTAYFNVLRANDNLRFVQANKEAVARQLEQTKQRFNVGLTAITDVHEAQAEFDRTLAEEIQAQNQLSNSYEALRELTGVEHRALNELNTARFTPSPLEQANSYWLDTANERNFSLNALRLAKEIADEQIELAQEGRLPTLNLVASAGIENNSYGDDTLDRVQGGSNNSATVGLQFAMPLYTGGAINSQVRQAQYSYVLASEALEQGYRSVQSTVNSVVNNVRSNIGSVKAYEQTVVSSRSALEAAEASFEVGTRTIVDVQNATRNLYSALQLLSNARYDYILNMLALKQASGELNESDLIAINDGLMPAAN